MPFYYLETNALIGLRRDFNAPKIDWCNCYSSQLAFMELMKGITEKSYPAKRDVLVAAQAAGIRIDWEAPIDKFVKAFGLDWEVAENAEHARLLHWTALEAPTLEQCRELLRAQNEESLLTVPETNLEVFSTLQTGVIDATVRSPSRLPRRQGRAFHDFLSNRLEGVDTSEIKALTDTISKEGALLAIAQTLVMQFQPPEGEGVIVEMLSRYNGALDTYVSAMSEYFATKVLEKQTPARNDAVDLSHFVYLSNPSCRIVSDDKGVLAIASSINERKGLTLPTFRAKKGL